MLLSSSDLTLNVGDGRVKPRRIVEEQLVRVGRGVYIKKEALTRDPEPWKVRARVAEARLLAFNARASKPGTYSFTGESAMVALGLEPWWSNPNISVRRRARSGIQTEMSAIPLGVTTVPGVRIQQTSTFSNSLDRPILTPSGLPNSPVSLVVLDLARSAHPLQAFHDVSVLLRFHARFSRWQLEASRTRAQVAKNSLNQELHALRANSAGVIRGFQRALKLINVSEPGVDSPAESIVLWALHCVLEPGYIIQSQRAFTANGRNRFVDIALPEPQIAIEVSGFGKFGGSSANAHEVAVAAMRRLQDLDDLGWSIINVTYRQAKDIKGLISYLTERLSVHGVKTRSAQGELWLPPTAELFARDRRS